MPAAPRTSPCAAGGKGSAGVCSTTLRRRAGSTCAQGVERQREGSCSPGLCISLLSHRSQAARRGQAGLDPAQDPKPRGLALGLATFPQPGSGTKQLCAPAAPGSPMPCGPSPLHPPALPRPLMQRRDDPQGQLLQRLRGRGCSRARGWHQLRKARDKGADGWRNVGLGAASGPSVPPGQPRGFPTQRPSSPGMNRAGACGTQQHLARRARQSNGLRQPSTGLPGLRTPHCLPLTPSLALTRSPRRSPEPCSLHGVVPPPEPPVKTRAILVEERTLY